MPFLTNKITDNATPTPDEYFFEDIQGSFQRRGAELQVIKRRGIDDVFLRDTGTRGQAFTFNTVHYVLDKQAAIDALDAYLLLLDGSVREIIQHSESQGYYLLIGVKEVERRTVVSVKNAIIANASVRQVCQWTAIHVPEPGA